MSTTYIVVYVFFAGGLGGLGIELSDWLIKRGAKQLILTSRRGITNAYQLMRINTWRDAGVKVLISTSDAADTKQAQQLITTALQQGPIGGIFNLAMVSQANRNCHQI